MSSVINTNVASLNAQRNLTTSESSLATSLQRLSSGLRINSAKDDAAGLAISDRFTTQIRGLNQAARNANDAISLSQTAEGALGEVSSNLQRIRELAVQSANATNSTSDRAALDLEVQQRLAEIDRISSTTSFNGQKILDGTFGNADFQVGANVGQTISLDLSTSMRQDKIGSLATASTSVAPVTEPSYTTGVISDFDFSSKTTLLGALANKGADTDTTNSYSITFTADNGQTFTATAINDANLAVGSNTELAVKLATNIQGQGIDYNTGAGDLNGFTFDLGGSVDLDWAIYNGTLTVDRVDGVNFSLSEVASGFTTDPTLIGTVSGSKTIQVDGGADIVLSGTTETDAVDQLQAALDIQSNGTYTVSSTGGVMSITSTADSAAIITGTDASFFNTGSTTSNGSLSIGEGYFDIQIGDANAVSVPTADYSTTQALVDAVNTALGGNGAARLNDDGTMSILADETITITTANDAATLGLPATTAASGSLTSSHVTTVSNSNETIMRIDAALKSVSDLRSTFGAVQNRFQSTVSNLGTAVESLSAARSRILDADFASETANLTRAQILQQAGTTVLSQANALPQNVLSLLG